MDWVQKKI